MGFWDLFKNITEEEELDDTTGLPKHLVERMEKGYIKQKEFERTQELTKPLKLVYNKWDIGPATILEIPLDNFQSLIDALDRFKKLNEKNEK